jgi:hypothetical protein
MVFVERLDTANRDAIRNVGDAALGRGSPGTGSIADHVGRITRMRER